MEVDLVYLWCDGSDKKFIKRKADRIKKEKAKGHKVNESAVIPARFVQVDELKYSLMSVAKNMPWINHIYIVTDRQVPNFKLPDNATIIDHSEILPKEAIPTFNILAIEANLWRIPNLSEHFLVANDDTFVYRELKPSFFFDRKGRPIVRGLKSWGHKSSGLYETELENAQRLIEKSAHQTIRFMPHHNIDGYLKSDCEQCDLVFMEELRKTTMNPFLGMKDIHRSIFSLYSLVAGRAKLKMVRKIPFMTDSMYFRNTNKKIKLWLKLFRPALFCINDTRFSTDDDRADTKAILESIYGGEDV